jgi:cytochrome c peroxidase
MRRSLVLLCLTVMAIAGCGKAKAPPPCAFAPELDEAQCAQVRTLELPATLPAARGNAAADNEDAALLGFRVFFDARFSANGLVACASCHTPNKKFADGIPIAKALGMGNRNSPTVLNSALVRHPLWDGRADSLWSQPLFAFENPVEMDFTRLELARAVFSFYRLRYERAFGPMPDLSDTVRFPLRGKPGEAAWDGMAAADQLLINRIVSNLGKSIEAYLRKLVAKRSPMDRFLAGESEALSPAAQRGLGVLVRSGCAGCHSGTSLSDERYYNLGVPAWPGQALDPGRSAAFELLTQNPFNAQGSFYDGARPELEAGQESSAATLGAFRTPSLRNLNGSAPYMHNGRFETLEEAVDFHLQGGGRDHAGYVGEVSPELQPVSLEADDRAALLELLRSLDGAYPGPPWYDWPES